MDPFAGAGTAAVIFAVGAVLCLLAAASGGKVKLTGAELSADGKANRVLLLLVGVTLLGASFLALAI